MLQFTPPFRNFVPKIRYTYHLTYKNAQFTLAFLLQTLTIYKTLIINPQFNALNIIHHLAIYKSSINSHPIFLSYPSLTSHLNFKSLQHHSSISFLNKIHIWYISNNSNKHPHLTIIREIEYILLQRILIISNYYQIFFISLDS